MSNLANHLPHSRQDGFPRSRQLQLGKARSQSAFHPAPARHPLQLPDVDRRDQSLGRAGGLPERLAWAGEQATDEGVPL